MPYSYKERPSEPWQTARTERPVSEHGSKNSPLFGIVRRGILLLPVSAIAVVVVVSFTAFWPYDMTPVPDNHFFEVR